MPKTRKSPAAGVKRGSISFAEARAAAEHAKTHRASSFEHSSVSSSGGPGWERYLGHFGGGATSRRGARKSVSKVAAKRSPAKRGAAKKGSGKRR